MQALSFLLYVGKKGKELQHSLGPVFLCVVKPFFLSLADGNVSQTCHP